MNQLVRLGDFCEQDRNTVRPGEGSELRYIGLETIESGTGQFQNGELSKTPEIPQANSFRFRPEHVLYGKLRPYLNKVALPDFDGKCSTEIIPLKPKPGLDRRYLFYFLRSADVVDRISRKTAGARMPRADMDFVLELQLPLPPLEEQRRVVDLLARAEGIVRLRREAQKKATEIIPALFLDMFGDPATNAKGFVNTRLAEIAEVVSGITKGRKLNGRPARPVPYLRVANVQAGFLNLEDMKEIEATDAEIQALELRSGDIVVTEGGDFDKLGRGVQWRGEIPTCIHQNHVFRVRLRSEAAVPDYFEAYLQTSAAKNYFLSVAKRTTNLASINMTQLRSLPVVRPPFATQREFSKRVAAARSIMGFEGSAIEKSEVAFAALLNRAFSYGNAASGEPPPNDGPVAAARAAPT